MKRAGDTCGGGEQGLGWKKGGDDDFPFCVPFAEFPCQSPAAESQPRINFKGRLGMTHKCRVNNIVPRPFPTQPKNGLRTRLGDSSITRDVNKR